MAAPNVDLTPFIATIKEVDLGAELRVARTVLWFVGSMSLLFALLLQSWNLLAVGLALLLVMVILELRRIARGRTAELTADRPPERLRKVVRSRTGAEVHIEARKRER